MKILWVAIGSSHGDDEIAWLVVDHLILRLSAENNRFIKSNAGMTDWLSQIGDAQCVIFLDAVISEQAVGEILVIDESDLKQHSKDMSFSSHGISLADSIELARNIQVMPENIHIYGISVGSSPLLTHMSTTLSANILKTTDKLCDIVMN